MDTLHYTALKSSDVFSEKPKELFAASMFIISHAEGALLHSNGILMQWISRQ